MADRIVTGKLLNAGQICLAPDYLLVPQAQEERIVRDLVTSANALYPNLATNGDYAAVLGDRNRDRLGRYVEEARQRGARVTEVGTRGDDGRLPLTIVQDCQPDAQAMTDETFGDRKSTRLNSSH